ncbi:MAG: hypothetical protein Q7R69_03635 [bacterium]|nr:hypothetical protein [bacterium]
MKSGRNSNGYLSRPPADSITEWLIGLFWILVGLVVVFPYTYLAGGGTRHLWLTSVGLLIASAILYALYHLAYKLRWIVGGAFWMFLVYCTLPIFVNGISIVFKWVGLVTVGSFIFEYRYASLLVPPLAIVIGLVASAFAKALRRCRPRGKVRPPSQ